MRGRPISTVWCSAASTARAAQRPVGGREQPGQRVEQAAAGLVGGRAGPRGQHEHRHDTADQPADDGLLQPQHHEVDREAAEQRVQLAEHERDEEDHQRVGEPEQVQRAEDAHQDHRQHHGDVGPERRDQRDRPDQPDHRPGDAVDRLAHGLGDGRGAGEGDEGRQHRPVVALLRQRVARGDRDRGGQRHLHRLAGRERQPRRRPVLFGRAVQPHDGARRAGQVPAEELHGGGELPLPRVRGPRGARERGGPLVAGRGEQGHVDGQPPETGVGRRRPHPLGALRGGGPLGVPGRGEQGARGAVAVRRDGVGPDPDERGHGQLGVEHGTADGAGGVVVGDRARGAQLPVDDQGRLVHADQQRRGAGVDAVPLGRAG
ncbi:hypothetical protein WJX68_18155 [Pseudonocardia sp. DW16-2]|uniref:Uncharacterized protein n=1 Tax=Pseudonocardia spirodelae TaxID=3133431 RepID=A0ABU8TA85_9PSEU